MTCFKSDWPTIYSGGKEMIDPHLVYCTAITERLNSTPRLVTRVDPYTLQGKSLPPKWGKYSATNIGQIAIHPFILDAWKRSCDMMFNQCNSLWPMIAVITAITRMDTLEWLSMQSLPVSPMTWLFVWPRDYSRAGASLWKW